LDWNFGSIVSHYDTSKAQKNKKMHRGGEGGKDRATLTKRG